MLLHSYFQTGHYSAQRLNIDSEVFSNHLAWLLVPSYCTAQVSPEGWHSLAQHVARCLLLHRLLFGFRAVMKQVACTGISWCSCSTMTHSCGSAGKVRLMLTVQAQAEWELVCTHSSGSHWIILTPRCWFCVCWLVPTGGIQKKYEHKSTTDHLFLFIS